MRTTRFAAVAVGLALALGAGIAAADEREEPNLIIPYGMSIHVGGGVAGFVDEGMRDMTDPAGEWEARAVFGTRLIVGFEAGYSGTVQSIDALGLDTDALLLSTGVEGLVRLHLLDEGGIRPYMFAGAGWRRYDLTNADVNTSSVLETDDVLEIPVGVGVGYQIGRVIVDVRGTVRPTFEEDLVPAAAEDEENTPLDTWNVAARVGFEF